MHPVLLRVTAQFPDEEAVVEDVSVAQGRTLRESRGARRVLDVDRVSRVQRCLYAAELALAHPLGLGGGVPVVGADVDHALEPRHVVAHLVDHLPVVARLERLRCDERRDPGLSEDVVQLVRPVGGVDVDEDRADLRGGELHQRPLGAVRRPDADPVARLDADGQESASERVHVSEQSGAVHLLPCATSTRASRSKPRHGGVEVVADRLLDERGVGLAAGVRQGGVEDVAHGSSEVVRRWTCLSLTPPHGPPLHNARPEGGSAIPVRELIDDP